MMATVKTHVNDCKRILGEDFQYVHEWFDKFAKKWNPAIYFEYHRQFRHNQKGVDYVKEKWGFYAQQSAKLHIIRDNDMYLLVPIIDIMREDQIDKLYEQAVKFCHPLREDWQQYIGEEYI